MVILSKIVGWVATALATIWLGLMLVGTFAKLYLFIRQDGFLAGWRAWGDWFDPMNPIVFVFHVIEASPALALLALAQWLTRWRANREARISN